MMHWALIWEWTPFLGPSTLDAKLRFLYLASNIALDATLGQTPKVSYSVFAASVILERIEKFGAFLKTSVYGFLSLRSFYLKRNPTQADQGIYKIVATNSRACGYEAKSVDGKLSAVCSGLLPVWLTAIYAIPSIIHSNTHQQFSNADEKLAIITFQPESLPLFFLFFEKSSKIRISKTTAIVINRLFENRTNNIILYDFRTTIDAASLFFQHEPYIRRISKKLEILTISLLFIAISYVSPVEKRFGNDFQGI
uniref:Uncharacterized protein n=1 Tax=Romanomermis culicivorax TaxID=13658 RepID=A0A915IZB4_ROMCU